MSNMCITCCSEIGKLEQQVGKELWLGPSIGQEITFVMKKTISIQCPFKSLFSNLCNFKLAQHQCISLWTYYKTLYKHCVDIWIKRPEYKYTVFHPESDLWCWCYRHAVQECHLPYPPWPADHRETEPLCGVHNTTLYINKHCLSSSLTITEGCTGWSYSSQGCKGHTWASQSAFHWHTLQVHTVLYVQ